MSSVAAGLLGRQEQRRRRLVAEALLAESAAEASHARGKAGSGAEAKGRAAEALTEAGPGHGGSGSGTCAGGPRLSPSQQAAMLALCHWHPTAALAARAQARRRQPLLIPSTGGIMAVNSSAAGTLARPLAKPLPWPRPPPSISPFAPSPTPHASEPPRHSPDFGSPSAPPLFPTASAVPQQRPPTAIATGEGLRALAQLEAALLTLHGDVGPLVWPHFFADDSRDDEPPSSSSCTASRKDGEEGGSCGECGEEHGVQQIDEGPRRLVVHLNPTTDSDIMCDVAAAVLRLRAQCTGQAAPGLWPRDPQLQTLLREGAALCRDVSAAASRYNIRAAAFYAHHPYLNALTVDGEARCVDSNELRRRLEAWLGGGVAAPSGRGGAAPSRGGSSKLVSRVCEYCRPRWKNLLYGVVHEPDLEAAVETVKRAALLGLMLLAPGICREAVWFYEPVTCALVYGLMQACQDLNPGAATFPGLIAEVLDDAWLAPARRSRSFSTAEPGDGAAGRADDLEENGMGLRALVQLTAYCPSVPLAWARLREAYMSMASGCTDSDEDEEAPQGPATAEEAVSSAAKGVISAYAASFVLDGAAIWPGSSGAPGTAVGLPSGAVHSDTPAGIAVATAPKPATAPEPARDTPSVIWATAVASAAEAAAAASHNGEPVQLPTDQAVAVRDLLTSLQQACWLAPADVSASEAGSSKAAPATTAVGGGPRRSAHPQPRPRRDPQQPGSGPGAGRGPSPAASAGAGACLSLSQPALPDQPSSLHPVPLSKTTLALTGPELATLALLCLLHSRPDGKLLLGAVWQPRVPATTAGAGGRAVPAAAAGPQAQAAHSTGLTLELVRCPLLFTPMQAAWKERYAPIWDRGSGERAAFRPSSSVAAEVRRLRDALRREYLTYTDGEGVSGVWKMLQGLAKLRGEMLAAGQDLAAAVLGLDQYGDGSGDAEASNSGGESSRCSTDAAGEHDQGRAVPPAGVAMRELVNRVGLLLSGFVAIPEGGRAGSSSSQILQSIWVTEGQRWAGMVEQDICRLQQRLTPGAEGEGPSYRERVRVQVAIYECAVGRPHEPVLAPIPEKRRLEELRKAALG